MILTESQLNQKINQIYKEEQIKIIQEKWDKLTGSERKFIFEFVKEFTPSKAYMLTESKWYNAVGDILGIFDPSGVVDAINAVSYFKQGDILYGAMSLISAVPYIGDAVGKPIVLGLKAGGTIARDLKFANDATKWGQLALKYPIIKKLVKSVSEWGDKIIKVIEKVPGGKRFTGMLKEWVEMIKKVPATRTVIDKSYLGSLPRLKAGELKIFRDYGLKDYKGLMRIWKKGGFFSKNRQLSKLLARTKFWLGFLDYIGVANFVGPDESIEKMGQEEFDKKMEAYMATPEAEKNWTEEMANIPDPVEKIDQVEPLATNKAEKKSDPLLDMISTLLGAAPKLA